MARKILHIDLDAFFCAVEEKHDPALQDTVFAVSGQPGERGVVLSASYAARRFGVRSAMPVGRALKLCPSLTLVRPRHGAYSSASEQVMGYLGTFSGLVEQISIDEAFLDLSDTSQPGRLVAGQIQAGILDRFGLPSSIGIATNKLVAKTATDVGKAIHRGAGPPFSILEVPPGEEAAFLAPLPVQALWGIGPKTAEQLSSLAIHTIGELARVSPALLSARFGKMGIELSVRAQGIDHRPVEVEHEARSISQETTFDVDERSRARLEATLRSLSDGVGYRLRQDHLGGSTVRLKLRWPDFSSLSRQTTLSQPTDQDNLIYEAVLHLFGTVWRPGKAVRLLGVGVSHLSQPMRQLDFLSQDMEKEHRLLEAMDGLRSRYGEKVVFRASALKNKNQKPKT